MDRTTTKGRRTRKGENDGNDYVPPHLESEAASALSDLELVIPFVFGGKEAVTNMVGYTNLAFTIFDRGYILILVHWCRYQKIYGGLGVG